MTENTGLHIVLKQWK